MDCSILQWIVAYLLVGLLLAEIACRTMGNYRGYGAILLLWPVCLVGVWIKKRRSRR